MVISCMVTIHFFVFTFLEQTLLGLGCNWLVQILGFCLDLMVNNLGIIGDSDFAKCKKKKIRYYLVTRTTRN
jgi:hypothetical protein